MENDTRRRSAHVMCGALVAAATIAGCAPEHCIPGDYTQKWACPSEEMVEQQVVMTDAFETFFFELTEKQAACVTDYWYRQTDDTAMLDERCGSGNLGCYGDDPALAPRQIIVIETAPEPYSTQLIQRHEVLHMILDCIDDPLAWVGHSHPAFLGQLPEFPDGSRL